MSRLRYLYAVLPAGSPALAGLEGGVSGIGGAAIAVVRAGQLAGPVSDVPADEFDEAPLNDRLRDLAWLGPRAAQHQEVNARLFAGAEALLPLAFGAVFRTDESVQQALAARQQELLERLESVRGRSEWVVTLARDAERAVAALEVPGGPLARLREEIAGSAPGRAFLLGRRIADVQREQAFRADAEAIAALAAALAPVAVQTFQEPLVAGAAGAGAAGAGTAAGAGPVARLSVLVARAAEHRLLDALATLRAGWEPRGYDLSCTGPWPPYRFGGLDLSGRGG